MTDFETRAADWLSYPEALARVLSAVEPLATEVVSLDDALGRYLAEPIVARATLPPWDNSAMDGYAVRASDLDAAGDPPFNLPVAGESYAGTTEVPELPPGSAIRIMTGAPLPAGADTVIRVEHTDSEASPGVIEIRTVADRLGHVRPGGQDMATGSTTLDQGTRVRSGTVAVLVASGVSEVAVRKRPRVGVLSSGDELVEVGDFDRVVRGLGIPDTNRHMLAAAVRERGGEPVHLGIAKDDDEDIRRILASADGLDALVTTGGASMGERDLFKRTLEDVGLEVDFWRVKIRPGSPVSFGWLPMPSGRVPIFGLPGNPASAFVTFHVLVAPFLEGLQGAPTPGKEPIVDAICQDKVKSPARLTQFFRVTLASQDDELVCRMSGPQGSGLVSSLSGAQGLAIAEEGREGIGAGEPVKVLLLPGHEGWSGSAV